MNQPRDIQGRFSAKNKSETDLHLIAPQVMDDAELSRQLLGTATLRPGEAAKALLSPSSVVRASARVIGWDLPSRIRQQFSRDERNVLHVVRPDLVA